MRQADIYKRAGVGITRPESVSESVLYAWKAVSAIAAPFRKLTTLNIRYSILPALGLDGMIHCEIIEGSFNGQLFSKFIANLLNFMQQFPGPNSVIIMDNCRIHKAPEIREMIESR
jgi:hypothetical protein